MKRHAMVWAGSMPLEEYAATYGPGRPGTVEDLQAVASRVDEQPWPDGEELCVVSADEASGTLHFVIVGVTEREP